jgi:hypothetical protein
MPPPNSSANSREGTPEPPVVVPGRALTNNNNPSFQAHGDQRTQPPVERQGNSVRRRASESTGVKANLASMRASMRRRASESQLPTTISTAVISQGASMHRRASESQLPTTKSTTVCDVKVVSLCVSPNSGPRVLDVPQVLGKVVDT